MCYALQLYCKRGYFWTGVATATSSCATIAKMVTVAQERITFQGNVSCREKRWCTPVRNQNYDQKASSVAILAWVPCSRDLTDSRQQAYHSSLNVSSNPCKSNVLCIFIHISWPAIGVACQLHAVLHVVSTTFSGETAPEGICFTPRIAFHRQS